jgi:hypothetical protein
MEQYLYILTNVYMLFSDLHIQTTELSEEPVTRKIHSLTQAAETFLRSRQLCSYSRIPRHLVEPDGLLPCSQEPSTGPYSKPD